jgi:hypothetical protein
MTKRLDLVDQAFNTWKRLIDAIRRASNAEQDERHRRLIPVLPAAWRRYSRRRRAKLFKSMSGVVDTTKTLSGSHRHTE